MFAMMKSAWRWGWDIALSVPLLLMLPYAIYFSKLLRFINRTFLRSPIHVKGDVVLITGASSGIGQYIAREYAKRGAKLVLAARRQNRLQEVAEECMAYGAEDALVCRADLTNPEDCRKIVDFTISSFGRLNVLVNNAGTAGGSLFEEYENISKYKRIMDVDFWGHVYTTQCAYEHLRRTKGQIVVTASMIAFVPFPYLTVYSASKAALLNFFETLRIESIGKSITVTIAFPGFVSSQLTAMEAPGKVPWWFPLMPTEDAAEEIVEAALRKERDVITPSWYSPMVWWKLLLPEMLEWVPKVFILGKPPTTTVETICNVFLGKSGTQTLFETLKLA
ncbi:hypothetical protein KI387_020796 [Taxus chinensis]|uniref:11-beta-hydroxysteroid dehydrogenase n=1 Tax=Taxus chinensis TaxID=29808 RepID=A0AA38LFB4_TAXCH|nr:hypothetical protein KI387_020796 [Taxus chinensis]